VAAQLAVSLVALTCIAIYVVRKTANNNNNNNNNNVISMMSEHPRRYDLRVRRPRFDFLSEKIFNFCTSSIQNLGPNQLPVQCLLVIKRSGYEAVFSRPPSVEADTKS
jgi:hypothetical protein